MSPSALHRIVAAPPEVRGTSRTPRLAAVIPVHNEEASIREVVMRARAHCDPVLVVDDGSDDASAEIARLAGARVLRHARRRGKGAALQSGIEALVSSSADALVLLDGDGQHDPRDIPRFVDRLRGGADVIVGDRSHQFSRMSLARSLTNRCMTALLDRAFLRGRAAVRDSQCGFRLISSRAARELYARHRPRSEHFEIESELLVSLVRLGFHFDSVPIAVAPRRSHSKIRAIPDAVRFLRLLARLRRIEAHD